MAEDIILTGHAGRSNIGPGGIDIAEALAHAQPPGGPVLGKILLGVSGNPETGGGSDHAVSYRIDPDGTVTVTSGGYEPVIRDGKITALSVASGG